MVHNRQAGYPLVVGGLVLDIQALPDTAADVQRGTSVPGKVSQVPGGVARNIAEGLAKLLPAGQAPVLLGVVGHDGAGQLLLDHCRQCGVCVEAVQRCGDVATPTVVAVFDRQGEVAACIASVAAVETHMTPELLRREKHWFAGCRLVVLDANLTSEALGAACQLAIQAGVQVFLEPVSVPKAVRAVPSLHLVDFISPNTNELIAIANTCRERRKLPPLPTPTMADGHGKPMAKLRQLLPFVVEVLQAGTKQVVLTMGELGAAILKYDAQSHKQRVHVTYIPAHACEVVSLSGAGDSLVAGMVAALLQGSNPATALAHGMAVASITVTSPDNVAVQLDGTLLQQRTQQLLASVTTTALPATVQAKL